MKTIKLKPINNSTRQTILLKKNLLIKNSKIFKNLRVSIKKCYGRSKVTGHITSWHKQRGAKTLYRFLPENKKESKSLIIGINYDPNRNTFVSTNFNLESKKFFNNIFIKNTYPGCFINKTSASDDLRNGFTFMLKNIPAGTLISNISEGNNLKAKYAKAAGTFAQLEQKNNLTARIKLPSGNKIILPVNNFATIGVMSNEVYKNIIIGKAGRNRNLGKRPIVRGVAMNPVDHPHGGRTNGGRPSVTPWGIPTKNKFKLRKKRKK